MRKFIIQNKFHSYNQNDKSMKTISLLCLLLFIITCSINSSAGFYSSSEIYTRCTPREKDEHYFEKLAECDGYIAGVFDQAMATVLKDNTCVSKGITIGQIRKVFISYVDKNPNKMHFSADSVIENAMRDAFKCQTAR